MGPAWNGHVYIDGNGTPPAALFLDRLRKAAAPTLPSVLTAEASVNASPASGAYVPVKAPTQKQMKDRLKKWNPAAVVAVTTPEPVLAQYLVTLLGRLAVASGDVIAWRT